MSVATIHANFAERAAVHARDTDWIPSPMPGVDRKPLDRIGGEVARATSIVRYAPKSAFSPHIHSGGEEFLVLDGVFQDEHGDFPKGTYVRNPPATSHTPASDEGCVILVKLWQFDADDRNQFKVSSDTMVFETQSDGVTASVLHQDAREQVRIERWAADATIALPAQDGIEIFVIDGSFVEQEEEFTNWSWLRLPKDAPFNASAGPNGAEVWIKSGHLARTPTGPTV